ncbi:MAG TPA: hypothetical protein VF026_03410 [Ktedonobacteraceae bacterium]
MPATLQITNKLSVTSLIDIQSAEFAKQYKLGKWWSMYGDEQGKGPVPVSYLVTNLKRYTEQDYFCTNDPYHLSHLGFFLGMYHGGILSPQTGQRRPDVTTLAHLDHRDAKRGYRAGREFYFVDAEPHERRYTEYSLIERLRESVSEMASWHDGESTWFFAVGCLLGELSGQLFPITPTEQRVYLPQRQRLEIARQRHTVAQEHPLRNAMLQEV